MNIGRYGTRDEKKMSIKRTPLDIAFSDYIRTRDKWTCRNCNAIALKGIVEIQCAHLHTRANKGIRVDPDNAVALCKPCHCYFTFRKEEWRSWCIQHFGQAYMDKLLVKYYGRSAKLVDSEKEILRLDFVKRTKALELSD